LFAGVSGDFSPLSIEAAPGHARVAPPALLVAVAVGLGTIDMPVPSVEEWAWLNWKFPRAVRAGDTIYARWTLTQKRPPIGAAPTSIVVWRVDVHTADGALCAEGEVGAKVRRHVVPAEHERTPETSASPGVAVGATAARRRRRRRPAGATGPVSETPAIAAPPAPVTKPERTSGAPRRRRRRRPSAGAAAREGEHADGTQAPQAEPAPAAAPVAPSAAANERGGLGGVIRRLRQPRRT
jgi:acyl dehydratase